MLSVKLLSLGIRRNRGEVAEVVVFTVVGDGFQVFGISTVGDADTGDLALLCHVYCLLFFHNRIVGELIASDSASVFYKTNNSLCVGIRLRDLVKGVFYEFLSVQIHHSFEISFRCGAENMQSLQRL